MAPELTWRTTTRNSDVWGPGVTGKNNSNPVVLGCRLQNRCKVALALRRPQVFEFLPAANVLGRPANDGVGLIALFTIRVAPANPIVKAAVAKLWRSLKF